MTSEDFAHLHVHTHYSLLDGKSTCKELVEEAASLGQSALAITDHGNCFGHYDFYQEAHRVGIKPILGTELYYAPSGRRVRKSLGPEDGYYILEGKNAPGRYTHLTAWALNADGLRNLYELGREASDSGMYYKPRVDAELLGDHSGGIAVSTGCMGSEVNTHLRAGELGRARDGVARLREMFPGRTYIEVMNHGIQGEDELIAAQLKLASDMGLPAVATNDSHYTYERDSFTHSCLLGVQTRRRLSDPKLFRFNGSGYHLRSRHEMQSVATGSAILDQTLEIAGMVDGSYGGYFSGRDLAPKYVEREREGIRLGAPGRTSSEALSEAAYASCPPWAEYEERLSYELGVIEQCGFSDYFLVLADIVAYCKRESIRVGPGRGSAGGCLTANLMGITDIDPIAHNLLFERFLNPQRVSPPDIDVDVQDDRRDEVLQYVTEKYGAPRVATVMALNTIGAKAALHDSAFVLGSSRETSNQLTYRLPPMVRGRAPSLAEMDVSGLSEAEEKIVGVAKGFEGLVRAASQHPSAVIISPEDLTNTLPVWKKDDRWVTGFDYRIVDKLGLVKFDLLGLKTLRIIDECVRLVRQSAGPDGPATLFEVPAGASDYDDRNTYRLLSSGNTLGCFQVEGSGMQRLLRQVQPGNLGDVAAVLSLYRPGPMDRGSHEEYAKRKHGRAQVEYPHPEFATELSDVLAPTYGLIVYQEQVMEILNRVCGWSYAEAGVVFNALRKKDRVALAQSHPAYLAAAERHGYSREAVDALWDTLIPFADYSFNKSHAIGYAITSYHTAFLKANHTVEFMAALLSAEDDAEKQDQYVGEATRMGVTVKSADVNESASGWTVNSSRELLRGLASIRGVGSGVVRDICANRPYIDFDDFLRRVSKRSLRVNVVSALYRADALSSLDGGGPNSSSVSDRDVARCVESAVTLRGEAMPSGANNALWGAVKLRLPSTVDGDVDTHSLHDGPQFALSTALTPEEWLFILTVCRNYPGDKRLTFSFRGGILRVPANVSQVPPELDVLSKLERI